MKFLPNLAILPRRSSKPAWTLAAVVVIVLAIFTSLFSWNSGHRTEHSIEQIELQAELSSAYQARSLACMDLVNSEIDNPERFEISEKRLNISNGIILCLVKNRDSAKFSIDDLSLCIEEVELKNMHLEVSSSGQPVLAPAC